ncbi:hypothetical protein AGOR_G00238130 [Albula goreensis]|uniref:Chemokine interleukin-8-like domain-containing protein n=1 Tax=Albula goreensis TaxID=1534307 RepID=A0A8T3CJC2_9TELE|nr:hypothetical protein AGOR_G00238130 [Albula goreensis]
MHRLLREFLLRTMKLQAEADHRISAGLSNGKLQKRSTSSTAQTDPHSSRSGPSCCVGSLKQPQKMAQFNLSTACLLLLLSVSLFSALAESACCTKYTRGSVPMEIVKGFAIQDNQRVCRIDAVIFVTLRGRKVCADPKESWVMKAIQQLRAKVQEMRNSRIAHG